MKRLQKLWSENWFVWLLWLALALAAAFPDFGAGIASRWPVRWLLSRMIFLCVGLNLPSETLWANLVNWRFHLVVQLHIFVVYPLVFGLLLFPVRHFFAAHLLLGFAILAVLPTSGTSCVLFCRDANGNDTLALVNSVLANLLGLFVSPFCIALALLWFFPQFGQLPGLLDSGLLSLGQFYRFLAGIVLPLLLGQLGRRLALRRVRKMRAGLSRLGNLGIVLIVFFSFSVAAGREGFFAELSRSPWPLVFLLVSAPLMLVLAQLQGRLLQLERTQRIALAFTASQKTIAFGVPLIESLFGDSASLVMIPLLFYHPWQLIVASFARIRYRRSE